MVILKVAGLHVRKSGSKLVITRSRSARAARPARAYRQARSQRNANGGYHLAMLAISAVIVFELIAIASSFSSFGSLSTTGYATGKQKPSYSVADTYIISTESCENVLDSNSPLTAGYVDYIYNGVIGKAVDSCAGSAALLEYSCDAYGRMISEAVNCDSGCLREGIYGYCA